MAVLRSITRGGGGGGGGSVAAAAVEDFPTSALWRALKGARGVLTS